MLYYKVPFLESFERRSAPSPLEGVGDRRGRTRTIYLAEEDPNTFSHIISWIYNRDISIQETRNTGEKDEAREDCQISEWCQLHVVAAKYKIKVLAIFALRKYIHGPSSAGARDPESFWFPTIAEVRFTYSRFPEEESHHNHHPQNQEELSNPRENAKRLLKSTLAHVLAAHLLSTLFGGEAQMEHWLRVTGAHREFWKDVVNALKAHMWERRERCLDVACAMHDVLEHPWIDEEIPGGGDDNVVESIECGFRDEGEERKLDRQSEEERKKRMETKVIVLDD